MAVGCVKTGGRAPSQKGVGDTRIEVAGAFFVSACHAPAQRPYSAAGVAGASSLGLAADLRERVRVRLGLGAGAVAGSS